MSPKERAPEEWPEERPERRGTTRAASGYTATWSSDPWTVSTSESRFGAMTPEEIDAKIAASEARTGERFAELRGDFNTRFEEIRGDIRELRASMPTKGTVILTGITSVLALGALMVGLLAYGGDRFGAGADISGIIERAATRAAERALSAPSTPAN